MSASPYRDAVTYDRISAPLERIGNEVLARLELAGTETVLDAGCGSGRVTRGLLARVPGGHVICVDASPEMLAVARDRLGPSVEYVVADLGRLDLRGRRVDVVFSTATFHWLVDHARLFRVLRAVLRPGGRLVAQCGGAGNTAELVAAATAVGDRAPFDAHLGCWSGPWNFAGPEETAARLRAAGFTDISVWLVTRPAPYDDLREWLRANALTAHRERLPDDLRDPFVAAVVAELGQRPEITYVRLNIDATADDAA